MDIQEIKEKKLKMESDISAIVTDFTNETQLEVKEITIIRDIIKAERRIFDFGCTVHCSVEL